MTSRDFHGYLSHYPAFLISYIKNFAGMETESFDNYAVRNFTQIYSNLKDKTSISFEQNTSYKMWKEGVVFVKNHYPENVVSYSLFFADMTLNEALLFIQYNFNIFETNGLIKKENLQSSQHFYSIGLEFNSCIINFPAPDGQITINRVGKSIVITVDGSC